MTLNVEQYQHCKPLCHKIVQDVLQFAPCPPPMLNYYEFSAHALSRNLTHLEVCSIARRCRPADPDVEEDCKAPHDRPPYIVIIVPVVCVVSFLIVTSFIITYVFKRKKRNIKISLNETSKISDDDSKPGEHNRRKFTDSNIPSESNTSDIETEPADELRQSVQSNGKLDIEEGEISNRSQHSNQSGGESTTVHCTRL